MGRIKESWVLYKFEGTRVRRTGVINGLHLILAYITSNIMGWEYWFDQGLATRIIMCVIVFYLLFVD